MALKIFLRHPWYDPEGYYRRVEDNPHTVDVDLADIPSTATIEGPKGEREKVWELRGEDDPATRSAILIDEQEARKVLPLARALTDPKRSVRDTEALEKENEQLRKDLETLQKKYEVDMAHLPDKTPPIQQDMNDGTNAVPGSNPATHGTQASAEGEQAPGASEPIPPQPPIPSTAKVDAPKSTPTSTPVKK